MWLSAEFRESRTAAAAIDALASEGFDKATVDVFSTKPVEFHHGVLDRKSLMSPVAVGGALVNAFLATAFMFWTQHDYPLVTGGMPLTSYWAVGVIIFEMAMAGAIAGTMAAFLWESDLFGSGRKRPTPVMEDDVIYLRVRCEEPQLSKASATLTQSGAMAVKRLEGRE
jgi:Alternative complex III, ActD subunit